MASADIMECLLGNEYTEDQVNDAVYKQIFPFLYVKGTQDKQSTYICVEIDPSSISRTLKGSRVIVWVYCDKGIMKYSQDGYKGTRADILADMTERAIREMDLGIGKMQLESANFFTPLQDYYGRVLIYNVTDFKIKGG